MRHTTHLLKNLFTHISASTLNRPARPQMVNVGGKKPMALRTASAESILELPGKALRALQGKDEESGDESAMDHNELVGPKGPIFHTAIIAGVLGAKKTSELIPFCHPLPLDDCQIEIDIDEEKNQIRVICDVQVTHQKTGVEMEAIMGSSIAALTIYDMCKAVSSDIVIKDTKLLEKRKIELDDH